ncbi:LacI family DNA-binding transcriptional regulator [Pseudoruegeria sp. HB172150]|uniref:LacI family DNA-binding transcriptional regulator n=1 Tax=Pseudoruegeria sp. HB172150 TaxID=2721164 RepID=UPI001551FF0A|nr:LacI family DNA-binding transcriptional regulator [Pseudoruegeria sp. HB172150]
MKTSRLPTAIDVAKRAGVSRSAVSRTFTEGASVSPETRAKVLAAAEDLGYRVNFLARGLIRQRTELVAMVVSDMDHSFRARLVDLLSRGLVNLGYRPVLLPWSEGDNPGQLIDMMLHYAVSGTIVTSDTPPGDIAAQCMQHGVPLVLVNKAPVDSNVARVVEDFESAGRLAADALAEAGCKRVAWAGQRRPSFTIGSRKAVFLDRLLDLGLDFVGDVTGARQNYAGGQEAAQAFLEHGLQADGVHCANDFLALGFMDGLRAAGVTIPGDLAVVGSDDIAEASWASYDLTTIEQRPEDLSQATLDALVDRIAHPAETARIRQVGVRLVRRGSTGAVRVASSSGRSRGG